MKIVVLVFALAAANCTDPSRLSPATARRVVESIEYAHDNRTGYCFAIVTSDTYGFSRVVSIAQVPKDACAYYEAR